MLVQIPHGTHAGAGNCEERLIADFIERGGTQGLDLSCIEAGQPLPFVTDAAKIPKRRP